MCTFLGLFSQILATEREIGATMVNIVGTRWAARLAAPSSDDGPMSEVGRNSGPAASSV